MKYALALLACLILAACGGGGAGSPPPAGFKGAVLTGTAATGMPIASATVNVLCGSGENKTTTTASDGTYSVNISACSGPFVVTVSGAMSDTQDTLVSLSPSNRTPELCGAVCSLELFVIRANVTPLTHAIAALVASSGDPFDLVRNFAGEKSGITTSAVAEITTALDSALANIITTAGAGTPLGTNSGLDNLFNANGTGWDRVLDNVKVEVSPAGITLTNIAAAKVDDMAPIANGSAAPGLPANAQITLNKSNFKTALATPLPGSADDNGVIDAARNAFNACFAVLAAQRGTFGSPGLACANLAASDYLNDGKNGAAEFDKFLTDSKMDGAKFNKPEVLRFFTTQRVLVKLSAVRSDGVVMALRSVAENSAATGNTWKLRGNQRPYLMFVNGIAERNLQLPRTGAAPSAYTTGLNLYFDLTAGGANDAVPGTATGVSYVLVKGPGLAAGGQILRPGPGGCDESFVLAASLPPTPLPSTQTCSSYLKIASKAVDGSAADPNAGSFGSAPDFTAVPVADATIVATLQPMSAYTFEVHRTNGTVLTFVERLRGRPATLQEINTVRWNMLADATQAALVPGNAQSFSGGNLTISWVAQSNTPPVTSALAQIRTNSASTPVQERQSVAFSANTATLTNGGAGFPPVTNAAGGYQFVQLVSRTRSDMQLFSRWRY